MPRTKEKGKTGKKHNLSKDSKPSQTAPDQTKPWYFRKPTVTGRAMYAFQADKKNKEMSEGAKTEQNAIGS